jgi:hypothetical protein
MSVIYCHATDDYIDTDYVLPDQHAFESHSSADLCCEGGYHKFKVRYLRVIGRHVFDCDNCGMDAEYLREHNDPGVLEREHYSIMLTSPKSPTGKYGVFRFWHAPRPGAWTLILLYSTDSLADALENYKQRGETC